MILSLTGFGRASFTDEAGRINVELKAVNNRFLQIDTHTPYGYNWVDGLIRQQLGSRVSRGKIHVNLEVVDYRPSQDIVINRPLLKKLIELNTEIENETQKSLPLHIDGLLSLPGVMKVDAKQIDNETIWARIQPVLNEAIESFIRARKREGENLSADLKQRGKTISETTKKIEMLIPEFRQQFTTRFTERITELAGKAGFDESRLGTEIAIWVDKGDVSEEITRLNSHLKELENILDSSKPSGRRLDFLVQELNREANTLGSKISDVTITNMVLDIKCEIEKIREQAQNIE